MLHSAVGSRKLADLVKDKGGGRTCIIEAMGRWKRHKFIEGIPRSMLGNLREGLMLAQCGKECGVRLLQ